MLAGSMSLILAPAPGMGDIVFSLLVEVSGSVEASVLTQEVLHAVE